MPASAKVHDVVKVAQFLSPEEWEELHRPMTQAKIAMRCCGWPGLAAELKEYETRYFRHRPGSNCPEGQGRSENIPHLLLRLAVAQGVIDAGWEVDPDYGDASEGYGVLAWNAKRKVLFAIPTAKFTAQNLDRVQTLFVGTKYSRVIWLLRRLPPGVRTTSDLRAFQLIKKDDNHRLVEVSNLRIEPQEFARRGLVGGVRYARTSVPSGPQAFEIYAFEQHCLSCGSPNQAIVARGTWTSACGRQLEDIRLGDLPVRAEPVARILASLGDSVRVEHHSGHGWVGCCVKCARRLISDNHRFVIDSNPEGHLEPVGHGVLEQEDLRELGLRPRPDPHWCAGVPLCPASAS